MQKICLILLCGLPASGKTTFVRKFMKHLDKNRNFKSLHICYDELMPTEIDEKIFKNENDNLISLWKSYRLEILNCIKFIIEHLQKRSHKDICMNSNTNTFIDAYETCKSRDEVDNVRAAFNNKVLNNMKEVQYDIDNNWLLIIDDNMWLQSMRYQVCQLARKCKCSFSQIYFPTSPVVCLHRNSLRDETNKISEETIVRMSGRMEEPDQSCSWERFSCAWSDDDDRRGDYIKVLDLLSESFNHPCLDPNDVDLLSNQSERLATLTSVIHQSDVILRKAVSKWVAVVKQKFPSDNLSHKVRSINSVKGDLLGRLRLGRLILPPMIEGEIMGGGGNEESTLFKYLSRLFDDEMMKLLKID